MKIEKSKFQISDNFDLWNTAFMLRIVLQLRRNFHIGGVLSLLFIVSCNSLPLGEPPEGPIIITNNPAHVIPKYSDGGDAVNYMITSLVTRCHPIASAGKDIPEVLNSFTVSHGKVNELPLEVWQKLIRMKMIQPVSNPNNQYDYSLVSEIEEIQNSDSEKKKYLWKMRLLQADSEDREAWKADFEFVQD